MAEDQDPTTTGIEPPAAPLLLRRAFEEKLGLAADVPAVPVTAPSSRTSLSPEDRRERAALGGRARARKLPAHARRKIAKAGAKGRIRHKLLRERGAALLSRLAQQEQGKLAQAQEEAAKVGRVLARAAAGRSR